MDNFSSSPLYDYFRNLEEDEWPEDERAALDDEYNLTDKLLEDLFFRLLNEKFFIIFITAKGGEGKSTIARWIYHKCKQYLYETEQGRKILKRWEKRGMKNPRFGPHSFCFTDSEFMDQASKAQPLEIIIKDENFETFAQIGGRAEKERKRMLLSRIRARQINFILIDPIFDDSKLSQLFTFKIFANDISFEGKKNRSIIFASDYDGIFRPIGHLITGEVNIDGYNEKKNQQLDEIQKMSQPEYKKKRLREIVDAMVNWVDPVTKERDDIRNYYKDSWHGIIQRRMDEMGKGGLRAGTEIKEIKATIDAFYPKKLKRKQGGEDGN